MNQISRQDLEMMSPQTAARRLPEIDLAALLKTLWRRRMLIAVCVGLAVLATWFTISGITPIYTATSQVMIESRRSRVIDTKDALTQMPPQMITVLSEVEVIRARNIAQRVAQSQNLFADPEFNAALRPPENNRLTDSVFALLGEIQETLFGAAQGTALSPEAREQRQRNAVVGAVNGRVDVSPVPQSMVIRISFQSPDPEKAARIANAFAETYVTEQLEAKFEAIRRASGWLTGRLEDLRSQVIDSERAVAAYRQSNNLIESRGQTLSQQKISELNSQLVLAQAKRAEQEARVARIETLVKGGRSVEAIDDLADSPLLLRLKEQEAQLSREASELGARYGERHPQMAKVRAELVDARRRIQTEAERQLQAMRSELAIQRERIGGLTAQIKSSEGAILEQSRAEIRLRELEREAQANRVLYEAMLSRFKETGDQEPIQQPDARIIAHAQPPQAPSHPRRNLLLVGAVLVGLLVGGTLVLVLEQLDNRFRSREQVETTLGLPLIGTIPQVWSLDPREKVETYLLDKPASAFAEAFRILWFSLKHQDPEHDVKVVMVTSSIPEEGKSLSALCLARTAMQMGIKTVLVDADMRRPSVARMVGMPADQAIVDVLAGKISLEQAISRDPVTGLDLILGRPADRAGLNLVALDMVSATVEKLREMYDLVIIDSPPVLPLADVQALSKLADRTIFCVRWDRTPRTAVSNAIRMLQDVRAQIAGVVLTRVNVRKHARYGYGDVGYYYGRYRNYYTS